MKDILAEAQFLRILLYLKRSRRRNDTCLYLTLVFTHALAFEYSTMYQNLLLQIISILIINGFF